MEKRYRRRGDGQTADSHSTEPRSFRVSCLALATGVAGFASRWVVNVLKGLIRVYQLLLSPLVGGYCRYFPTCSEYARQALDQHGPVIGLGLAVRRISRCHPWGSWGLDPVPGKSTRHTNG